jgi:hypothetical protein
MEQVKTFFRYIDEKEDAEKIEKKMNEWLKANPLIQITYRSVTCNEDEGTLFTIFYKDGIALG